MRFTTLAGRCTVGAVRGKALAGVLGVVGILAAVALPAASGARGAPRADLVVSKGSIRAKDGKLAGSFTVRNAGPASSKRSSAALTVKASGKYRVVKRFSVPALDHAESLKVNVSVKVPKGLPAGSLSLRVCADRREAVRERSEDNNCRGVGRVRITRRGSSRPTDPIDFNADTVFTLDSPESNYWIYVPSSYNANHTKPITLFVWMHGCGGQGEGDIYNVSPTGDQSYIAIALGGREGDCWDPNTDTTKVLAAIANVKTHFNINPRRVILGGYSSGGDLSYRTAFYHAKQFAGVLAENTTPFRDTGSTQADSIAAAAWKFHIVHLAHTEDDSYPIAGVRDETDALKAAGFPITRIERPGSHYDADTADSGTDYDLRTILLPHISDGWLAP